VAQEKKKEQKRWERNRNGKKTGKKGGNDTFKLRVYYIQHGCKNMAVEIRRVDHVTPSIRKNVTLTSPTSGGRSVGIILSKTKATELLLLCSWPPLWSSG
jgi:P2-related tail formation protein